MGEDRISKDEYYLNIARECSRRGTCLQRNFGAIVVKNDQIISTGYTGAPRGRKNCCDLGTCLRREAGVKRGTHYELCRSVHAEMNAIIHASRTETIGATMYLYGLEKESGGVVKKAEPCSMCKKMIINSGIEVVKAQTDEKNFAEFRVQDWIQDDETLDFRKLMEGY